jgi:hypothetical protein
MGGKQIAAVVAVAILTSMWALQGAAQNKPTKLIELGKPCVRKTDKFPGVVKKDACDRLYCGRADQKDVMDIWPTAAKDLKCTWRLEDGHCRCRYGQPASQPK